MSKAIPRIVEHVAKNEAFGYLEVVRNPGMNGNSPMVKTGFGLAMNIQAASGHTLDMLKNTPSKLTHF